MGQFNISKWNRSRYLAETREGTSKSTQLTGLINKALDQVDEFLNVEDFASSVANILKEEYGSHLFSKFMGKLHAELGMDVSEAYTSEWDPETAAKNLRVAKGIEPKYTTYTKGEKVTYLGHPAVITGVKEYNGKIYYSVSYDKGNGKTKASSILSTDGTIKSLEEAKSKEDQLKIARAAFEKAEMNGDLRGQELALAALDLIKNGSIKGLNKPSKLKEMSSELGYLSEEEENLKEYTISGGQEAARNYPKSERPGDMFAQKEVEELLPQSFASRNQELKARLQAHANWVKQGRFNNTFVHVQSNTVTDGNNTYRVDMSQHYNGNYEGFKNPKFTEIRVKELGDEFDMEKDLGYYIVDTTALMQDLRKLETIERVS